MSGGSSSGSKPIFYDGQKELASQLFAPGGMFASLLGGGPDVGFERNAARGQQGLVNGLAQQGLTGSGLAAKSLTNYASDTQGQRQDNSMRVLLDAIQPAGTRSFGSSKGLFGI
jgi:hypothetical protein